jgi:hypothetical protein
LLSRNAGSGTTAYIAALNAIVCHAAVTLKLLAGEIACYGIRRFICDLACFMKIQHHGAFKHHRQSGSPVWRQAIAGGMVSV